MPIFTFLQRDTLRLDAVGERKIYALLQATDVRVQCYAGALWGDGRITIRAGIDGDNFVDIEELNADGVSASIDFRTYAYLAVEVTAASSSAIEVNVAVCAKSIISN